MKASRSKYVLKGFYDPDNVEDDKVNNMFQTDVKKMELEARLGKFKNDRFYPGVSEKDFIHINATLQGMTVERGGSLLVEKSDTLVSTSDKNERQIMDIHDTDNIASTFSIKENREKFDNKDWGYRIALSFEKNIKDSEVKGTFDQSKFRIKLRNTYIDRSDDGIFSGMQIDTTRVSPNGDDSATTYEVEIERIAPISQEKFFNALYYLYAIYRRTFSLDTSPDSSSQKRIQSVNDVISQKKMEQLIYKYNNLFGKKRDSLVIYRNKPRNIKLEDMQNFKYNKYAASCKYDGVRKLLWLESRNVAYMVNPPNELVKIDVVHNFNNVLLDTEMVQEGSKFVFYCFDIMRHDGKTTEQFNFNDRLKLIQSITSSLKSQIVVAKKFFNSKNIYQNIEDALKDCKMHINDGIILQPINQPYNNKITLKWKPAEKLSIDFTVKDSKIYSYNPKTKSEELFIGTDEFPYRNTSNKEWEEFNNSIVEFSWDGNDFKYERFRDDRPIPNQIEVAKDVWYDINNPLTLETLTGKNLKIVDDIYDNIKLYLINKYVKQGNKVLYIGDMNEIVEERLAELETTVHSVKDAAGPFDVVCAFFSLDKYAKDEETMKNIMSVVSNVKNEGYVIGTVLDGEQIENFISNPKNVKSFSIEKVGEWDTSSSFGNRVDVDGKETYLFDFSYFNNVLKNYGIEKKLATYLHIGNDDLPVDSLLYSSLNRGFVFQKVNKGKNAPSLDSINRRKKLETPVGELYRVPTISDNSSFVHAIVQSFSKTYKESDKQQFVAKTRAKFAHALTLDVFKKLGNGIMARKLIKEHKSLTDNAEHLAYAKFKLLINSGELLQDTVDVVELVSNILNINIFILGEDFLPYLPPPEGKMERDTIKQLLYKDRRSIILLNIENIRYETLSLRSGKMVFDYDDDLIQTIFGKL